MCQLAWKRQQSAFTLLKNFLKFAAMGLLLSSACWAQIPQASDTTSTPVPDAGHDYIHSPLATVNPGNGSLSVRIPVRIPEGRELTLPFSFAYDSNGMDYLGQPNGGGPSWAGTSSPLSSGGWSETGPMLTVGQFSYNVDAGVGTQTCAASTGYIFQDPSGNRHNLDLSVVGLTGKNIGGNCDSGYSQYATGGVAPILATTTAIPEGGIFNITAVTVTDGNGTVYTFPRQSAATTWLASQVMDRNGNYITVNSGGTGAPFSFVDTVGRTVLSDTGFAQSPETLTVAGLSAAYKITWTTLANTSFTSNLTYPNPSIPQSCPGTSDPAGSLVISSIELPNGQKFTFSYNATYGLLDQITYPTGGYVQFVWGMNTQSESGLYIWDNNTLECNPRYDAPAITDVYISLNGTTNVQHQHYAYSTTWDTSNPQDWDTKTTTVTTYDLVRNTSFKTVYTYAPFFTDVPPNTTGGITEQMGNEKTIAYYDTSGALLKTVTKNWYTAFGQQNLESEQDKLPSGTSSFTMLCINGSAQVTEKDEYDYGTGTPTPASSCSLPSGAAGGSLLRKTVTSYASFSGTNIVDLPSSVITYNGSGTRVAETDSSYDQTTLQTTSVVQHTTAPGGSARGNLTTVAKQCFEGSSACSQGNSAIEYSYYDTGQIYQVTDPENNISTFSYTDSYSSCSGGAPPSGSTHAFLTQVTYPPTNGVSHIISHCWDYPAGLLKGTTDENSETTLYTYADTLDRLTKISYPDGGETLVSYNDTPPTPSFTIEKELSSGEFLINETIHDGMGLATETELTSDPAGTDLVLTSYDGLGRKYTVSNPYRTTSDPTYGVTTYTYDALGRTTQVLNPDSTTVTTTYTNRATEVTDEGNGTKTVQRISQTDGLGRMVSVCEVSSATQMGSSGTPAACGQDISATGFLTTYQYDALDNLLQVNQGNLTARTFTYDSLSQLVTSTNPESGLTTYTYDANGNTASRTQPEANQTDASDTVTTTYVHDALDRLTAKEYSDDTGNVDYNYDETDPWGFTLTNTNGRLTTEYDGNTGSVFSYDAMGRIVQNHQCTPQNCGTADFPIAYTYDLDGDMLTSTDGQLNLYTRTYNNAAELISLVSSYSDSNHPGTLYSSTVYNAPGQLTSALLGNGITESRAYNSRLEMTSASAGSVYSLSLGYAPNGDMTSTTDSVNGTWTYSYDDFNRLIGSSCSATCPDGESTQGFSYSYDRFANRWDQTVTAGSGGTLDLTFTGDDNQIDGYSYDAAGNLMNDGSHTYYYDAEHHLVQVDGTEGWCQSDTGTAATACYTYDAEGRRVRRSVPGVGDTDDYLYDLSGHFITQMSSQGTWVRGEIYAAGEHIATYENDLSTPTTFFTHSDHLGTERVQTAVNGSSCETITNTAFGDGMNETGSCDPTALRFTDKLRDYETNLDDFGARFYSSQLGRFMSADWSAVPAPVPYANLSNPQTLNLYAIVADNPETFADLDGHCQAGDTAQSACPDPPDTGSSLGEPSSDKVVEHPTGTVPSTSVAQQAQAKQQQNQAQQENQQPSRASAGVLALGIGARALIGAEEGGEAGAAAGTVEPGGGNVVGAVIGAVAGAATAALAPTIYSKTKDALDNIGQHVVTAVDHLGKLNGPDKNPYPRRGWRQTVRKSADNIDKIANKVPNTHFQNLGHFVADALRGLVGPE